jgi:hypothetical protein
MIGQNYKIHGNWTHFSCKYFRIRFFFGISQRLIADGQWQMADGLLPLEVESLLFSWKQAIG